MFTLTDTFYKIIKESFLIQSLTCPIGIGTMSLSGSNIKELPTYWGEQMNQADALIDIIDRRIDSYIKNARIVCKYVGKIISMGTNQTARVTIIGFDTIFTFPYRDYLVGKN